MAAKYDEKRTCGKCRFWFVKPPLREHEGGDCRRWPPSILPVTVANSSKRLDRTQWPLTLADQWCGEFTDEI